MKRCRSSYLTSPVEESLSHPTTKQPRTDRSGADKKSTSGPLSDVEDAIHQLKSLYPLGAFDLTPSRHLPPIILKHQLYALVPDRTYVDRQLQVLIDNGTVRLFKLGVFENDYALVLSKDYKSYVCSWLGDNTLCRRVIEKVLPLYKDVSISKEQLSLESKLTQDDISTLVNKGVLLVRDIGDNSASWWFAIPGVSPFIKSLTKGRSMVQQMLKKTKYKEMLRSELMGRKLSVSKFSMEFHLHDLIGADIVECIDTTSGMLLRLVETSPLPQDDQQ